MKKINIVTALVIVFTQLPIWFYLLYKVLSLVGASELMWFLFWVYVPVSLFAHIVTSLFKE